MALLSLTDAQLAYGHWALLDRASLSLEAGERLGLIGRNGTGKSSLLKILAGLEKLDDGLLQQQQGLRRHYLPQEPSFAPEATIFDAVSEGVAEAKALRERYEAHQDGDDLDAIQTRIEALDGWTWEQRVDATLQRLALDPARRVDSLSGGLKKRVALAQALVAQPDVLFLDEPTNHLDLDAIVWLQELLAEWRGALIVVTHDRSFLDAVATRIIELDRGILRSYPGRYSAYEATKQRELESEALLNARADKLLAQEEVWVRQGVEARRTRSVARIGRLEGLRAARAARRDQVGRVKLDLDAGERSGQLVAVLEGVSKAWPRPDGSLRQVVSGLDLTVLRGDRLGIVGPNGAGKTTLLKLILGNLAPDEGVVRTGTKRTVAYFDQLREVLDPEKTLAETISPGSDWVEIGNARKHVIGYLGDFLFPPQRANAPVRTLSGGERNRLLLARLFAQPANVLVLDEPTNDLDIETLELLEELLASYPGTVFLVSHDRRFVDAVVTSVLVAEGAEGEGRWKEYEGGIEDWLVQSRRAAALQATAAKAARSAAPVAPVAAAVAPPPPAAAPAVARRKLSYKEQRELDALPERLAALEAEQKALEARLADPGLYATLGSSDYAALQARHAALDEELLAALERWEALGG
ncbi:ATP-binding cassette domain-containing protein [Piscinibacter sp. Jin2]|uniref:ATP-binding protein Uup n=1 Tax=Aquariibacter lacus TaxID=2801332 RepID=A0A9X1BQB5_9BURK|nr:ATP-binding cassette domain-containing protein [Piscinibacter lacus]MBL0718699.1 ATP-binding cassette domain-containing protein [Piscinibacter lacus]